MNIELILLSREQPAKTPGGPGFASGIHDVNGLDDIPLDRAGSSKDDKIDIN